MSSRSFIRHIRGTLRIESPLHIGGGQTLHPMTDQPYLRADGTPDGEPALEGSSLRGVLRAHATRDARLLGLGQDEVNRLFGFGEKVADARDEEAGKNGKQHGARKPGKGEEAKHRSMAGRLTVRDAVCEEGTARGDFRDHVRISAGTGAADEGAKFDEEITARGLEFPLHLIYEGDSAEDAELLLVRAGMEALQAGALRIGGGANRGYGVVKLAPSSLRYADFARSTGAGLLESLKFRLDGGNDGLKAVAEISEIPWKATAGTPGGGGEARPASWYTFELALRFEGPVLVKSTTGPIRPEGFQPGPGDYENFPEEGRYVSDFVFNGDGTGKPFIPGTGVRGVLRQHAMRICRARGIDESIWQTLFGMERNTDAKGKPTGHKSLLEIRDAYLADTPRYAFLDHVAIDRFTGFTKTNAKFDSSCLDSPEFAITVRLSLYGQEHLAQAALWMFLLRDMNESRLWFGSGTTRGYGRLHSIGVKLIEAGIADGKLPAPAETPDEILSGRQYYRTPTDDLAWLLGAAEKAWKAIPQVAA